MKPQGKEYDFDSSLHSLESANFGTLQRLRVIGDGSVSPVTDAHVKAIASTATGLREVHVVGSSSISVIGRISYPLA